MFDRILVFVSVRTGNFPISEKVFAGDVHIMCLLLLFFRLTCTTDSNYCVNGLLLLANLFQFLLLRTTVRISSSNDF